MSRVLDAFLSIPLVITAMLAIAALGPSIIQLPGGTGLKLTTAKFYSPEHQNYAGRGIRPHHNVPLPQDTRSAGFRPRTSDEIRIDPDVARALEILGRRFSQN